MIEEINRMQQLAGINEIKVNNPLYGGLSMEDFIEYRQRAQDEFYNYGENISEEDQEEYDRYNNLIEDTYNIKDIDEALFWLYSGDQNLVDDTKKGLQEIKVNKPTVKWSSVLQLITDLHKMNGRNSTNDDMMRIASKLGWKENGQTITTFFEENPKKLPTFYAELKKLRKINEIKVTNLQPTPEKVTKLADHTRIISSLHPKISEIMNTYIPKRMLEDESFKSWKDIFYQLPQPTLNKIYLELYKLTN